MLHVKQRGGDDAFVHRGGVVMKDGVKLLPLGRRRDVCEVEKDHGEAARGHPSRSSGRHAQTTQLPRRESRSASARTQARRASVSSTGCYTLMALTSFLLVGSTSARRLGN